MHIYIGILNNVYACIYMLPINNRDLLHRDDKYPKRGIVVIKNIKTPAPRAVYYAATAT